MKTLWTIATICGALAVFSCNNNSNGGSQQPTPTPTPNTPSVPSGYASTPQPCNNQNLPAGTLCQQSAPAGWNPAVQWTHGAWIWPSQYNITVGSCGCPSGYFPVHTHTFGMACAPVQYQHNFVSHLQSRLHFQWQVQMGHHHGSNGYWNYPQNGYDLNQPITYYHNPDLYRCHQATAQGCDVRLNNCPTGGFCQPVAGGSTLGLCRR